MNTANAEALGVDSGNNFPQMAFTIEKVTVTALTRALKAEYTMELAQDLKAIHGLDAETERYFVVDGNKSIEDTHTAIISRVSEIAALKRNAREDKGNLLLRPIRAAGKAVRTTAKAVNKAKPKKKATSKK